MADEDTVESEEILDAEPVEELSDEILTPEDSAEVMNKLIAEGVPNTDAVWLTRMNSLCIPAVIFNEDLRIRWRNTVFADTFENRSHPMLARSLDDFFIAEGDSSLSNLIKPQKETQPGFCWHGRIMLRGRSADNFMANLLLFPLDFNHDGRPDNYLGMVDDITKQYKQILRNTFLSLLEASKLKDNDTGHHIERVNRYSYLMAKRLLFDKTWPEVDDDFIENISFLAAMHDVGKIGVPDDILNKEGPLEDWEMEVMKEHTKNGAFILSSYPNPMAREIALFHHEKWNGGGYPYGISETMIPLSARIVSIADVYDALRSKRSYKKPFSHKKALEIMENQKGTHFDPVLLDLFMKFNKMFEKAYDELSDPSDVIHNDKD
jgi:putative two-component system response regulator